jgi:hypothetical protein
MPDYRASSHEGASPHARASMIRCRAMGEIDEMREQAARAVEGALSHRTVGLFSSDNGGGNSAPELSSSGMDAN